MAQVVTFIKTSKTVRYGALVAAWLWVCGICISLGSTHWALHDLPELPSLSEHRRPVSITFKDRYGQEIGTQGSLPSAPANLDILPAHLPEALLSIEDRRFYSHFGVDPIGIARAMYVNKKSGRLRQGGSTLTQQLAKNLFLENDQTLKRKAQESYIAVYLEQRFSKREIIELYLGRVYFGSGAYGIDAAAERYFAKPAADLTIGESAMLTGLLKAPSDYAPTHTTTSAANRATLVVQSMVRDEVITSEQRDAVYTEKIWVDPPNNSGSEHYFMDFAAIEMTRVFGTPKQDIVVHTTLDLGLQSRAADALTTHLAPKRGADEGAIVTLDGTGALRAMVGGASYGESQFNRVSLARRQPGSAFKPFVYLTALRAGVTPEDLVLDEEITIDDWTPRNFKKEHLGEITIERSFAASINTVAVKLSQITGPQSVADTAAQMGLADLKPYRSIALGAQDVSPLALTQSYLPFSNNGYVHSAYAITMIETPEGAPLYRRPREESRRVLGPLELRQMNQLMHSVVTKGTGRNAAVKGREVAGKTGTTNDYRDAWFVGYAPDLATGVWIGNDKNEAMSRVTGGSIPARLWSDVMTAGLEDMPKRNLPRTVPALATAEPKPLGSLLEGFDQQLPN